MTRAKLFDVAIVPVTVLCILLLAAPVVVLTQGRFQVESRDVLAQSSLVIYTIRDSQLATCYTLFVLEPPPPPPVLTATEPAPPNRAEEARAARNEQLAALRVRVDARTAGDRVMRAIEDETARKKIEDEFDRAIRGVPMMSTLPWTAPLPGMQTSGTQYQAESTRRATVDPTGDRVTADSNDRLERWLMQAAQAPRIAATGPVPCKPGVAKDTKP
jgi:hypothetical protein